MKFMFFILTLFFVTLTFARQSVDFTTFSEVLNNDIDQVIKDNPQAYEKVAPGRMPASVEGYDPARENLEIQREDTKEKINTFDQQNIGLEDW